MSHTGGAVLTAASLAGVQPGSEPMLGCSQAGEPTCTDGALPWANTCQRDMLWPVSMTYRRCRSSRLGAYAGAVPVNVSQ